MKNNNFLLPAFIVLVLCAASFHPVYAAVPDGIGFQAYLTNAAGTPVDADVAVTFAAYNVAVGGVPLWSQAQTMTVDQGLLSINLGNPVNPFPAGLFDGPVFIGMFVAGEELLPRREIKSTGFAYKAADADTLNGVDAASLDESGDIASLQGDLASTDTNVSSNTSDIAANSSDIVANAAAIFINDGLIANIEATGADITAVLPGAGLTGGASAGNATLAVANAGIVNSMLANDAVDPLKLNSTEIYDVGGLNVNGSTDLNGSVEFRGGSNISIFDNASRLQWNKADETTQQLALYVQDEYNWLYDFTNFRSMIYSNSDGMGIGTSITNSTHAVTIPSLLVQGNTEVGLIRTSTTFPLSSTTTCHSAGNLNCYFGSGSVQCPVGTKILGGGTSGHGARYGSMSRSYPDSDTSWTCELSYDLANVTRSCFAVCARLE